MSAQAASATWTIVPTRGFLDDEQVRQLDAIFGRLLPGDPQRHIPSAVKARASRFVSLLLAREADVYREIPAWRALYPRALSALEQLARDRFERQLTELADDQMSEVIVGLETGTLQGMPADLDQKLLFKTLLRHCYQGCFADPRWGGNDNQIMWRAIGYLRAPEDGLA